MLQGLRKFSAICFLSVLTATVSMAQLTGTKVIPTDYATIAAFVTAVNGVGVGAGGVTLNVPAGYTETAPAGGYVLGNTTLNATLSAANPLIIQKSGAGVDPLITAQVGTISESSTGGLGDAIFTVKGCDYVTFDGIDLQDAATNATTTTQMGYGYAFFKLNATAPFDGCNNNTIKNCTVTLYRTNVYSVGITFDNRIATSTTQLTITTVADASSNNTITNNTLQNMYSGIYLRGFSSGNTTTTLWDQNNTVGGASSALGNSILSWGGTTTGYGIYALNEVNANYSYNTINNYNGGANGGVYATSGTLYGIYSSLTSVITDVPMNITVQNNTITHSLGGGSAASYGVYVYYHSGSNNINNNTVTWANNGGLCTGSFYGIYYYYGVSAGNGAGATSNCNYNTVTGSVSSAAATVYGIYHYSISQQTVNFHDNQVTNVSRINLATGSMYGFYAYYSQNYNTAGYTTNIYNNTLSNITLPTGCTSASIYCFYYPSGNYNFNFYNNTISNIINLGTAASGSIYGFYNLGYYGTIESAHDNTINNLRFSASTSGATTIYGIYDYPYYQSSATLYNNTISNLVTNGAGGNIYGWYHYYNGGTSNIYNNRIVGLRSGSTGASTIYGMYSYAYSGAYANVAMNVYNNYISIDSIPNSTNNPAAIGIYSTAGTAVAPNFSYNTVYMNGSNANAAFGSAAFYMASATQVNYLRNNIFVNNMNNTNGAPTGFIAGLRNTGTALTPYNTNSNNNLWYCGTPSASHVLYYDGTNSDQSIMNMKTRLAPGESNSGTENPPFQSTVCGPLTTPSSTTYLHMTAGATTIVESGAASIGGITTDYDGDSRGSTPDMGADEFVGVAVTLAPPINFTSNTNTTSSFNITFDDNSVGEAGFIVSRSLSNVGPWTIVARINSTTQAGTGTTYTLAQTGLLGATTYYYQIQSSNASTSTALTGSAATLGCGGGGLSGTYSIPGAYASLAAAVTALQTNGMAGAVTLELTTGYAGEPAATTYSVTNYVLTANVATLTTSVAHALTVGSTVTISGLAGTGLILNGSYIVTSVPTGTTFTYALTNANITSAASATGVAARPTVDIASIPCLNPTNTLLIRPAAGTGPWTIASSIASPTVSINGSNFVTIDGRPGSTGTSQNLIIQNSNIAGFAVQMNNDASNNTITYCDLQGYNTNAVPTLVLGGGVVYVQSANSTNLNGNDNNSFTYCNIHGYGTTTNTFPCIGFAAFGSSSTTLSYNDNGTIDHCNIYDYYPNTTSVASTGIKLDAGNTAWNITNNHFFQTTNLNLTTSTATHRALWVTPNVASIANAANGFTITGNYIGGNSAAGTGSYNMTGTSSYTFTGMDLSVGLGTATSVQNNTITNMVMTTASTASTAMIGIGIANGNTNVGTTTGNVIGATSGNSAITFTTTANTGGFIGIRVGAGSTHVISNNTIGAIDLLGNNTTVTPVFNGINNAGATNVTISNNTVGHATQANSINLISTCATSTSIQSCRGIYVSTGTNTTITGNTIANMNTNYAATGAQATTMAGISMTSGFATISSNTIHDLTTASQTTGGGGTPSVIGINYSATTAPAFVGSNTIYGLTLTNTGIAAASAVQATGIYFGGPSSGTNIVEKNQIHNLSIGTTTNYGGYITGIDYGTSGLLTSRNNMIDLGYDNSGASVVAPCTIRGMTKNTVTAKIYFNSIYIGGTGVGTTATNTFAFVRTGVSGTDTIENNVFVNNRSNATTGGKHYAINLSSTGSLILDYNDYFGNGTGFVFGYNGADVAAYSNGWAVAAETHSYQYDPQYNNPIGTSATTDLHINPTAASIVESTGLALANVTDDIDGQTRASYTPTDMGADAGNFISYLCSAGTLVGGTASASQSSVCYGGTDVVTVTGNSGQPGTSMQWYTSPTGGAGTYVAVSGGSGATTSSYTTPGLTSTIYYECQTICSYGGTIFSAPISVTVNNPQITNTTPTNRCGTGSVTLSASGSGNGINWYDAATGGNLLKASANSNDTTYTTPSVAVTTKYYAEAQQGGTATNITLGTGTITNGTTGYPTPYGNYYGSGHDQYLLRASELQAMGYSAGNINSIAFNLAAAYTGSNAINNFEIRVGTTAQTALTTTIINNSGFTKVYTGPIGINAIPFTGGLIPTAGWNTYTCSPAFNWNGNSNVVIDVVFSNCSVCNGTTSCTTSYNQCGSVNQTATPFASTYDVHGDNNCTINSASPSTTGTTYNQRPNIQLNVLPACLSPRVADSIIINTAPAFTISPNVTVCNNSVTALSVTSDTTQFDSYIWTGPTAYLFNDAACTSNYIGASKTTVYFKSSASVGNNIFSCTANNSITLCGGAATDTVYNQPAAPFTAASDYTSFCISGSPNLSLTPNTVQTGSVQWQSSPTSSGFTDISGANSPTYTQALTGNTYFRAQVKNSSGTVCSTSNAVVDTLNNPTLTSTTPATRCGTGTATLGVTYPAGTTANWYQNATGGLTIATGNSYTTPVISSNDTVYVAASSGGSSGLTIPGDGAWNHASTAGSFQTTTITGAYVILTVLQPLTLNSVDIYPSAALGTAFTLEARTGSASGTTYSTFSGTTTVQNSGSPTVAQTLNLSWVLPIGTYYIGFPTTNPSCWRSSGTFSYPWTLAGFASFTSYLAPSYQYYCYNFKLATGCESGRTPVIATVTAAPTLTVSANQELCSGTVGTLSVTSPLSNFTSYSWTPTTNLYTNAAATTPYTGGNATTVYYKRTTVAKDTITCNATDGTCSNVATSVVTQLPNLSSSTFSVNSVYGCAGYNVVDVTSNYTAPLLPWYSNNFSSSTLVPAQAALFGNALISGGQLQLNQATTGQAGAFQVYNSSAINAKAFQIDFDLNTIYGNGNADGFSYSFGDDVVPIPNSVTGTYPNQTNPENGSGSKLKLSFDSYTNGSNTQGIYLMYNCTTANEAPTTTGVLGYVANTTWFSTAAAPGVTKHVSITIDNSGRVTVVLGTTTIFSNVQLPPAYLVSNKSTWSHVFAARCGTVYENHNIANFVVQYIDPNYFQYSKDAGTTWQSSNVFSPIATGSYPMAITYNSHLSCSASIGTAVVNPGPTSYTTTGNNTMALCAYTPNSVILNVTPTYTGATYQWQSSPDSLIWTNLSDAVGVNAGSATIADTAYNLTATTYYRCAISCSGTPITGSPSLGYKTVVVSPAITSSTGATRCGTGAVTLQSTATAGSTTNWYAAATGGAKLYTGSNYTTPAINTTTPYYVAASNGGSSANVGLTSYTYYSYSTGLNTYGEQFNATNSLTINTVDVYAQASTNGTAGTVTIQLQNSAGTVLQSATVSVTGNVTPTAQTVALGFNVTPGTGYKLVMSAYTGINGLSYYYNSGINFPYPYTDPSGSISITNGLLSGTSYLYYYYYFWNWNVTVGCESSRTAVTATVNPAPNIVISPVNPSICIGQSTPMNSSNPGGPSYTNFTWSPGGQSGQNITVSPNVTTTYTVTATEPGGCATTASNTVTVNPLPTTPTITPSSAIGCPGTIAKVKASGSNINNTFAVGTGTTVNSTTAYPSPYGQFYGSDHVQFLVLASELNALGYTTAGNLTSLGFNLAANYSGGTATGVPLQNYTIYIAQTTAVSAMTSLITPTSTPVSAAFTQVYGPATVNPSLGWNTYNFSPTFGWDGVSNVIIDVEFSNCSVCNGTTSCTTSYTINGSVNQTATSFVSTYDVHGDGNCTINSWTPSLTGTSYSQRPNIQFNYVVAATYGWNSLTGVSSIYSNAPATTAYVANTQVDSVWVKPTATNTYTATATITATGCTASATMRDSVYLSPTENLTGPTTFCLGATDVMYIDLTGTAPWNLTYTDGVSAPVTVNNVTTTPYVFLISPTTDRTYRVTALSDAHCTAQPSGVSDTVLTVITTNCTLTWNGSVDSNWNNANNWYPRLVPNSCSVDIMVPAGNRPATILTGNFQVGNIHSDSNAVINIMNGSSLRVCGTWTGASANYNSTVGGAGTVDFRGGSATHHVAGKVQFPNVKLSDTYGIQQDAGSDVKVMGILSLGNSTWDNNTTPGTFTLGSVAANTSGQIDPTGSGTLTGTAHMERFVPRSFNGQPGQGSYETGYHYTGSPWVGTVVSDFGTFYGFAINNYGTGNASPFGTFYSYCETCIATDTLYGYDKWLAPTSVTRGQGFAAHLKVNETLNVPGTYSKADVAYTLTNTAPQRFSGQNLISNPFPSSLSWDQVIADASNSAVDHGIYFWNPASLQYETYLGITSPAFTGTLPGYVTFGGVHTGTATGNILPMQGFFIHSNTNNNVVTFKNAHRTTTQGTFWRTSMDQVPMVRLNVKSLNGYSDEALLYLDKSLQNTFDKGTDALKMRSISGKVPTIFLVSSDNTYDAISGFNELTPNMEIPLGVSTYINGTYTINADEITNVDPTSIIMLEDRRLGVFHNLRNGSYSATLNSSDMEVGRFYLHVSEPLQATITDATCAGANGVVALSQDNSVTWDNCKVYDLQGNLITTLQNFTGSTSVSNLAKGDYRLVLTKGTYTATKQVTVGGAAAITALFTPTQTSANTGDVITFNDGSANGTSYSYNFGDGTIINGIANPTYSYNAPGTYNVILTITNTDGCVATYTKTITVSGAATGITNVGEAETKIYTSGNMLTVDFGKNNFSDAVIEVYDVIGQELVNQPIQKLNKFTHEFKNLEAAYILVKVKYADKVIAKKVFISNR